MIASAEDSDDGQKPDDGEQPDDGVKLDDDQKPDNGEKPNTSDSSGNNQTDLSSSGGNNDGHKSEVPHTGDPAGGLYAIAVIATASAGVIGGRIKKWKKQ